LVIEAIGFGIFGLPHLFIMACHFRDASIKPTRRVKAYPQGVGSGLQPGLPLEVFQC
jgi:hypothetical protein